MPPTRSRNGKVLRRLVRKETKQELDANGEPVVTTATKVFYRYLNTPHRKRGTPSAAHSMARKWQRVARLYGRQGDLTAFKQELRELADEHDMSNIWDFINNKQLMEEHYWPAVSAGPAVSLLVRPTPTLESLEAQ